MQIACHCKDEDLSSHVKNPSTSVLPVLCLRVRQRQTPGAYSPDRLVELLSSWFSEGSWLKSEMENN